eukprot:c9533_g1_i1.p1 GENE.c9533_g1_i1~~c9533_g1_i1.p1  ORF type:complete len:294 (-),score=66.34 c9533_g1_i1:89-970(-)
MSAFDMILTGAKWTTRILREILETRKPSIRVETLLQGVDTTTFRPSFPNESLLSKIGHIDLTNKFVIFSGGKLEFRKGQDLVIAAVRTFLQTHANAVFITAWHNWWPSTMQGISSAGFVQSYPRVEGHRIHFSEWLELNGISKSQHYDIGEHLQSKVAVVLRRADVGIFPNRAEGGTNLVLMEAMASGTPVIVSNNTGHSDIIHNDRCYPLTFVPLQNVLPFGPAQWGHSQISEIIDLLEHVYQNPHEAKQKGFEASRFIQTKLTWATAIRHFDRTIARTIGTERNCLTTHFH